MKSWIALCLLFGLTFAPSGLWAHSISFLQGDAVVRRDQVELTLNVRSEDILLSAGTSYMGLDKIPKADLLKGVEAHRKFLLAGIVIRDADGQQLTGKIVNIEMPPLPADGVPLDKLMATNFIYHLEYPLAKPPAKLGFQQRFDIATTATPVVMQLQVLRMGQTTGPIIPVPTGDTLEFVAFDWTDEMRSPMEAVPAFEPPEAFVYIQNYEVRVEILMPLRTLETWRPVARADPGILEIAEQSAAQPALGKWFTGFNELKIDGVVVKPRLDRLEYYGVDSKDFAALPEPKRLSAVSARVGAILTYSTKGMPRQVELKWAFFNEQVTFARAVVLAYDQGARIAFSPEKATYTWDNPGTAMLPKIESVLAKQGSGDDKSRAELTETLLRNVYRGFDYRDESDSYDALAQSVQGELLADIYLKIKQGLIMQEQGGAMARVQKVSVMKFEPVPGTTRNGFAGRVTWQVEGTVEHWGHIHTRLNEYSAELGVAPSNGAWKIDFLKVVKQSLVKSTMAIRNL